MTHNKRSKQRKSHRSYRRKTRYQTSRKITKGGAWYTPKKSQYDVNVFGFAPEDIKFLRTNLKLNDKQIKNLIYGLQKDEHERHADWFIKYFNKTWHEQIGDVDELKKHVKAVMPSATEMLKQNYKKFMEQHLNPKFLKTGWEVATGQLPSLDKMRNIITELNLSGMPLEQKRREIEQIENTYRNAYKAKKDERIRKLTSPFRAIKRALTPTYKPFKTDKGEKYAASDRDVMNVGTHAEDKKLDFSDSNDLDDDEELELPRVGSVIEDEDEHNGSFGGRRKSRKSRRRTRKSRKSRRRTRKSRKSRRRTRKSRKSRRRTRKSRKSRRRTRKSRKSRKSRR